MSFSTELYSMVDPHKVQMRYSSVNKKLFKYLTDFGINKFYIYKERGDVTKIKTQTGAIIAIDDINYHTGGHGNVIFLHSETVGPEAAIVEVEDKVEDNTTLANLGKEFDNINAEIEALVAKRAKIAEQIKEYVK